MLPSLKRLARSLLPRSRLLYRGARVVADHYVNQNNADIHSNGELWLLRQMLPKARVVLDVGANVGDWAALALAINPAIELHCFEPSLATYRQLTGRGLAGNVVFNNVGLGATRRDADLHVFESGSGLNSFYRRDGLQDGFNIETQAALERVRLDTADEYCREHGISRVDFCKVDVEGYEMEVFSGMTRLLDARQVRVVQFEYGGCNIDSRVLLQDLFRFFLPRGYVMHQLLPTMLKVVPRYDQRWENFQYQNWVAIAGDGPGHEASPR
jgi:FkbM family methyltransferase